MNVVERYAPEKAEIEELQRRKLKEPGWTLSFGDYACKVLGGPFIKELDELDREPVGGCCCIA